MNWKRSAAAVCLAAGLGARLVGAQEPAPSPTPAPVPTPAPEPQAGEATPPPPVIETPKDRFFGDRFALYLEVRAGAADADGIEIDVESTQNLESQSETKYEDIKNGEFTIGWTLPRDRGQYLFTYSGHADGGYKMDSTAYSRSYVDPSGGAPFILEHVLPWGTTSIRDGQLHSIERPPVWDSTTDDANFNGIPDDSEITFPTVTEDATRAVPDDLGSQLSTYDLYYRREFGGTRYHARWTAGGRYLEFDGALPLPMWVNVGGTPPEFTDGVVNPLVISELSATGWGPVGSAEMQFNFFRRRLQLYALARAAFIVLTSKLDSGDFQFLVSDPAGAGTVPRQGHFSTEIDKSSWNTTLEAGVRFRILPGFHVFADYNASGFLDPVVVPTKVSFPVNAQQIDQPIGVSYKTEDMVFSTVQVGVSFQF